MRDTGVELKSRALEGKRVGFGICGGIGAVECVRLIREVRRHGADITAFLTPSAARFITPLSISWACQSPVRTEAGSEVDHLDEYDIVVVAPLTFNTMAKCALGMTDNAVALLVSGQLGRKGKLAFVPAMNSQLKNHPLFPEYQRTLENWGAKFLIEEEKEGRLKMPAPERFGEWLLGV
jgi:phosphopantothenoylcysteine decarboxylase / phosphopantothenate---cysteine ligase